MIYDDIMVGRIEETLIPGQDSYEAQLGCAFADDVWHTRDFAVGLGYGLSYFMDLPDGFDINTSMRDMLDGERPDAIAVSFDGPSRRFHALHVAPDMTVTVLELPLRAHPLHYAHTLDEAIDIIEQWRDELGDLGTSALRAMHRQLKPKVAEDPAVDCLFPARNPLRRDRQVFQEEVIAYLAAC